LAQGIASKPQSPLQCKTVKISCALSLRSV
jgi:hypothetical protein